MANTSSKKAYIATRVRNYLAAFAAILAVNFAIPRVMPGDPTTRFVGPGFTEAARQQLLQEFGLNRPIWEQFLLYLANTLTGDFGVSFARYPTPVMDLIVERLPRTLYLMGASVTISVVIGIPLGAFAAWNFGEREDLFITQSSLFFRSIPTFWLAILLVFVFGYVIPIFPISGATGSATHPSFFAYFVDLTYHTVLPVVTMSAYFLAGYTFLMRGSLLDILPENYIKIAESKGLSERQVLFGHAVPPAFPPVLTQLGFQIGRLAGGAVLVETVFSYPGMGQLMFEAVLARDYPVIQATFFFLAVMVLGSMFLAEILYTIIDPRIGGGE
ncbi:ABC transporter permease [Halolamina sediminis]|jgi:peptide/nickel transport system permease protein|uniref:ABC transporter permease n=1 Tax=Halolamina sediminis TaxID=1480675 RepID=UPI0006B53595|nr:ABC transporter permease [Halolamina sediminis]